MSSVIKKPVKYEFDKFKRMYTPFYIEHEFEAQMDKEVTELVDTLHDKMKDIGTKEGLLKYIREDEESLENILSLLSFSAEKFKRIITMFRMDGGEDFRTEWNLDRIRNEIISNKEFGDKIARLLLQGATEPEFTNKIPKFYLENLVINEKALEQLKDKFQLRKLIKKKKDGKYNNNVGDRIEDAIEAKLIELRNKYGVTYEREKYVPWIARNMDFTVPNNNDPHVIIEVSYQITTGSGQTTKRNDEVKTSQDIRSHNIQYGKNIAFVNFIEGLGWIARQSDMKRIYDCSDYVINLKTLDLLESIIIQHVPDIYFKTKKPKLV
jgi:DpnII restriction endonuclease